MSVDFVALAKAVVAGVVDVRACLIVSRDGLALGACPAAEEEKALVVWSHVAGLGEIERGFVALRDEVWAFARRGPYGALATAGPAARPGVLLDELERMLLTAEEGRLRRDGVRPAPDREGGPAEASRRPRSPLHPEPREHSSPSPSLEEAAVSAWVRRLRTVGSSGRDDAAAVVPEPALSPPASSSRNEQPVAGGVEDRPGWTVDRVALSHEFKGLLNPEEPDDEES